MDYLTQLEKEIKETEQLLEHMEYNAKPDAKVLLFICKEDKMLMEQFERELASLK